MGELTLIKILSTAVLFALAFLFNFISAPDKGPIKTFKPLAKVSMFLAVFSILFWSENFYMVFLTSEFIFLLLLWRPGKSMKLALGLRELSLFLISLVGCLLISGAFVIYSVVSTGLRLADLKLASLELYGLNFLYPIGLVFLVVPLLYRLGVLQFIKNNEFSDKSCLDFIIFKSTALLVLIKYSSAGLFMPSLKTQNFMQWALVCSILFLSISSLFESRFKQKIIKWMEVNTLLVVAAALGFVFDGEGSLDAAFYLFLQSVFYFCILNLMGSYFVKFKGAELSDLDFKGLYSRLPKLTILLTLGLLSLCSFPILLSFYTRVYVLKTSVQTGFYWLSFWSLFASFVCWLAVVRFTLSFYLEKFEISNWALWDQKRLKDINIYKSILFIVALLIFPTFVFYFPLNS